MQYVGAFFVLWFFSGPGQLHVSHLRCPALFDICLISNCVWVFRQLLDKSFSLACIAEKIMFPAKLPKIPEVQKLITKQALDGIILETSR
jgi:hypothetical protein